MKQVLLNGAIEGLLIATAGLAMAVVYWTSRRALALGLAGVFALTPYIASAATSIGAGSFTSAALAFFVAVVGALVLESVVHWPMERRFASAEAHLLAGLGSLIVIEQLIVLVWGPQYRSLRQGSAVVRWIGGLTIDDCQLAALGALTPIIFGFLVWIRRSASGLRFRALSDDSVLLETLGVNVRRARLWIFALAGAMLAAIALIRANDFGFDPNTGWNGVVLGLIAVFLGGKSRFGATAACGLSLGIFRGLVAYWSNAAVVEAATYAGFVVLLIIYPDRIAGVVSVRRRLEET